jgi:hypothetical protein
MEVLNVNVFDIQGGAATETIISYSVSVLWTDLFFVSLHRFFIMKVKSLTMFYGVRQILSKDWD